MMNDSKTIEVYRSPKSLLGALPFFIGLILVLIFMPYKDFSVQMVVYLYSAVILLGLFLFWLYKTKFATPQVIADHNGINISNEMFLW